MLSAAASAPGTAPPGYAQQTAEVELGETTGTTTWSEPPPPYEGYDASLWATPQMYQSEAAVIPSAPKIKGASQGDGCSRGCKRSMKKSPCQTTTSILCWVMLLVLLVMVVVNPTIAIYLIGAAAGFYLIYMLRGCCGGDAQYLSNIMHNAEVQSHINTIKQSAPRFWYHIECYHMKTEHYRDSKGSRRSRQKKVVTHRAYGEFQYSIWTDLSPTNPDFSDFELTKTKFTFNGMFGDQFTQRVYENAKNTFYAANTRDRSQTKTSGVKIDGFQSKALTLLDGAEKPWWISLAFQRFMVLVGCATCYKGQFEGRTGRLKYEYAKKIYCLAGVVPTQPFAQFIPQAAAPVRFAGEGDGGAREDSSSASRSTEGRLAHTHEIA